MSDGEKFYFVLYSIMCMGTESGGGDEGTRTPQSRNLRGSGSFIFPCDV